MIQPIEERKILSFYHDAKKLLNGVMVAPRFVSMWLTNYCNLECSGCWWMKGHDQSQKRMDTGKYRMLIDELTELKVEGIEYTGGGESTLHPDFCRMAMYAKEKGLAVGILTNGTVLSKDYLEKNECSIDTFRYVRVSLDAAGPGTYESAKKNNLFERVVANTCSLVEARGQLTFPRVGFKFLLNKANLTEMAEMVALAESSCVDYVQFKLEHSSDGTIDDKQARYADLQIRKLRKKADIPVYGSAERKKCLHKCFMSPIHAVIDCEGNVYACCFFSDERGLIGNAFEQGFGNVWFSDKHRNVMESITPEMCDGASGMGCRWFGYNEIMDKVISEHEGDLEFI